MFTREMRDVFDVIFHAHTEYGKDLTSGELSVMFNDRNPAMPDSTREKAQELILTLDRGNPENIEMHLDMVRNFWLRDRARIIGEKAIEIFTGESEEFGELRSLIESIEDGRISDRTTYEEVTDDLDELLDANTGEPDFPFEFGLINERVAGLDRGNLGIIFARPEVGKTTFCCFLAASYVRAKHRVVYWANEEPAEKIKLRLVQSFFNITRKELNESRPKYRPLYREQVQPYLKVMSAVGMSVEEVDSYAKLNKPDIMFCDQLDKFRISGEYNRGDERLKETYVHAREIAKRNKLLMWAVSQASNDGHDRQFIDYNMMDNSKTGKAGEADIIIGIGKTGASDVDNIVRHICISKNKINGWHGPINAQIDVQKGVYY
jgi:replicative DNA helicase